MSGEAHHANELHTEISWQISATTQQAVIRAPRPATSGRPHRHRWLRSVRPRVSELRWRPKRKETTARQIDHARTTIGRAATRSSFSAETREIRQRPGRVIEQGGLNKPIPHPHKEAKPRYPVKLGISCVSSTGPWAPRGKATRTGGVGEGSGVEAPVRLQTQVVLNEMRVRDVSGLVRS